MISTTTKNKKSVSELFTSLRKKLFISATEVFINFKDLPHFEFSNDYGFKPLSIDELEHLKFKYKNEIGEASYTTLIKNINSKEDIKVFGIWFKNQIAGYTNIAFNKIYETNTGYTVPKEVGNIYLFKTYVFKDFRRNDLHLFQTYNRCLTGKAMGYSTATGIIQSGNIGSFKVYYKLNFKNRKKIYCFKILNYKFRIVKDIEHKEK